MSGVFGTGRSVVFTRIGALGKVIVDGQDISASVAGVTFADDARTGLTTRMVIELAAYNNTDIQSDRTTVAMAANTRELLIEAGWYPPEWVPAMLQNAAACPYCASDDPARRFVMPTPGGGTEGCRHPWHDQADTSGTSQ